MTRPVTCRQLPWRSVLAALMFVAGPSLADCGATAVDIAEIQGDGDASSMVGQQVTVEGVITLDSRHSGGFRGFYLQQADGETDGNDRTSDALFIYTNRPEGIPGERVRLTGRVKEFHGLTELTGVSHLTVCGNSPLPEAVIVELPWPDQRPPEHLENMRVVTAGNLTLIETFQFERFGELTLAHKSQITPTTVLPPGTRAMKLHRQQALNRLVLDDGMSARNPRPLPWPLTPLNEQVPIRAGDQIAPVAGVLDYRFGDWRLQPDSPPQVSVRTLRPQAPPRAPSANLRVVNLNLKNFFNGDGQGAGFPTERGARTIREFDRQASRLAATLASLNADIIAAVEVENDDYSDTSAIAALARALGPEWRFIATPGKTGTDAIRTDILYRNDRVAPVGEPDRLIHGLYRTRGRPAIAQLFQPIAETGNRENILRVVVPHFKSKSCRRADGVDKDQNDGQGCYAHRRQLEATALKDWLAMLPRPEKFTGTLITGDLNSYALEWPLRQLKDAGYHDLVQARHTCSVKQCTQATYRYRGRHGSLDYSLASEDLNDKVIDAGVWPTNADEPPALGYRGSIELPADAPWRASDHNPVYTDFSL